MTASLLLLVAGVPSIAPAAATEAGGGSVEPTARAVALAEERQRLAAQRKQEAAERRARKRAEREQLAQSRRLATEQRSGTRATGHGHVVITCNSVTWYFENFPNAANNTVSEVVSIEGVHAYRQTFTFDGSSGSNTMTIGTPPGLHKIDTRAYWSQDGRRIGWDIAGKRVCGNEPAPGFVIEKRQAIAAGSEAAPTPLVGQVGQAVRYEIVITNTGNVTLSFSNFEDARCDPGTVTGGGSGLLEPNAFAKYRCQHVLTAADLAAGSYPNVASITGTGVGGPITKASNTVVVNVVATPSGGPGAPAGQAPSSPGAGSGTLAFNALPAGRGGVLGFSARVPTLKAPQGCVRGSFLASIASRGVQRATFYLDRRRVKTLSAKNARKGRLTVRISLKRVRVGPHRVLARITMKPTAASVKAVVASRSRTIVVCSSATLRPKFTG